MTHDMTRQSLPDNNRTPDFITPNMDTETQLHAVLKITRVSGKKHNNHSNEVVKTNVLKNHKITFPRGKTKKKNFY